MRWHAEFDATPLVDTSVLDDISPLVDLEVGFDRPIVSDVASTTRTALDKLPALHALQAGQTVAVTAGSRGIANIALILAQVCAYLRERCLQPVIVSAMGSHGGNSPEGQRALLASLGLCEASLGTRLICSTGTVVVGQTSCGTPVWVDEFAANAADAILLVNRIKPHTAFRSTTESGLLKMIAVGLGHQPGASAVHAAGPQRMGPLIREMARVAMARLPLVGGLAILENAYDETAEIHAVPPDQLFAVEERLLLKARSLLPRLPVREADVLIVEQIGKEISGTGMDTNIIGRGIEGESAGPHPAPRFTRVLVLGLTAASHGNATGIGLADFTTDHVVAALDRKSTYINCLTSTLLDRAMLPLFFPDDRQALAAALISLGSVTARRARLVQIRDTLHLSRVRLSQNLLSAAETASGLAVRRAVAPHGVTGQGPLHFDQCGRLDRLL